MLNSLNGSNGKGHEDFEPARHLKQTGCPDCGHNSYTVLTINREIWEYFEESDQFECVDSEYVEDVREVAPVCTECGMPWPVDSPSK